MSGLIYDPSYGLNTAQVAIEDMRVGDYLVRAYGDMIRTYPIVEVGPDTFVSRSFSDCSFTKARAKEEGWMIARPYDRG